ncbi:probable serine/threonine-protein kinase DDB_G0267514 [Lepeophtheirus salmonis]|uniref:probable serine/threonine-protein kinase DDB_G0267514 n=1 Tax=Lepeophtheirus salmonis TaxID=72036 RepID=UPI001AE35B35|nr:probable serine/threonine-protein kinase DDB_G0267514 [Lepeophtheirus salmonis]
MVDLVKIKATLKQSFSEDPQEDFKLKSQFKIICTSIIAENLVEYDESPIILGVGGFSNVYKGYLHGNEVAVKRFNRSRNIEANKHNFIHESVLSLQLHHPNLVLLIGAIFNGTENNFSLVYENMNLGSLEDYVCNFKKSINRQFIVSILRDVADGLAYLHDIPVVHMDLKMSNVLLMSETDGVITAKLGDLGLALPVRPSNDPESYIECIRGTPAWMASELLNEGLNKFLTPAVDMYSYGMLIWALFELKMPYSGCDIAKIYSLKAKYLLPLISDVIPEGFSKLIKKCWQTNPSSRPTARFTLNSLNKWIQERKRHQYRSSEA